MTNRYKFIFTLCFAANVFLFQAFAQQSVRTDKTDSLLAVLPALQGWEKLETMKMLIDQNNNTPAEIRYLWMYLDEARQQKNTEAAAWAYSGLTGRYYSQFDTDSVFIIGEEAIRYCRENQVFARLFFVHEQLIRRLLHDGKTLTALRRAEEAYEEAKEMQDNMYMARILTTFAYIYDNMGQSEEAARYHIESNETAAKSRTPGAIIFIQNYHYLCFHSRDLNRHDEALRYADSMYVEAVRLQQDMPAVNVNTYFYRAEFNRAMALAAMNRPQEALEAIRRAEALFDPKWSAMDAAVIDDMYGAYYHATRDHDRALEHLFRLLAYYEDAASDSGIRDVKKRMAQIYAQQGDYKAAYDINLELAQRKEELNREQFYNQINELRTLYGLDKTEMEVERHQAAIRGQRIVISGLSVAGVVLLIAVALALWSRRTILRKNRELVRKNQQWAGIDTIKGDETDNSVQHENEKTAVITPELVNETEQSVMNEISAAMERGIYRDCRLTLDVLAVQLGYHPNFISAVINRCTGKNFKTFINEYRVKEAIRLLSDTGITGKVTMDAIAEDAGFNDRTNFYRVFLKITGLSPTDFSKGVARNATQG